LFDGDVAAGPVPTLYAADVQAAKRCLVDNPVRLHADLQRLAKVFLMPEYISRDEAVAIIRKPR
jgi:hypothetical protein